MTNDYGNILVKYNNVQRRRRRLLVKIVMLWVQVQLLRFQLHAIRQYINFLRLVRQPNTFRFVHYVSLFLR